MTILKNFILYSPQIPCEHLLFNKLRIISCRRQCKYFAQKNINFAEKKLNVFQIYFFRFQHFQFDHSDEKLSSKSNKNETSGRHEHLFFVY